MSGVTRVLAVEDSRTQAEVLRVNLDDEGFEVGLARDGVEALARLKAEQFDIVVSDVVMPGMSGYELCQSIKGSSETQHLPVILLTSLTDPLDVVRGLECGADNFMRKPYQPDQLIARIRAALRNRHLRTGAGEQTDGVRIAVGEREFAITADRSQMLDLLVSTFQELVATSDEVRAREAELVRAHSQLEQNLAEVDFERNRLRAVVDSVPVPLFVVDPSGTVTHASEASARTFGADPEEIRGRRLDEIVRFEDSEGDAIRAEELPYCRAQNTGRRVSAGNAFDLYLRHADGRRLPVVLEASPVLDERGETVGTVGTAHVLGVLSQHDPVTGLPNNVAFLERAATLMDGHHGFAALLLLELDRFDVTRAALGHQATNQVLAEASRRLREVFEPSYGRTSRSECFLAHLGSAQFGVLLANLPDSFSVVHLADAARRVLAESRPGREGGAVTASVGVALADGVHDGSALFAAANVALRRARDTGGDHVELFGQAASQDVMDRLQLEVDLRTAVEGDEVELHYQPEIDLATGQLIGFEALARWEHHRLGPVRPDVFICLAEESGLILRLGHQLLRRACREAQTWAPGAEGAALSVAVNVSAIQLRAAFVEEVTQTLEETGLHPSRLLLEVTETAAMAQPEVTLPLLEELRRRGVRISLDDFGTGYSSMALLTRVHLDQLKLDRGFVAGIQEGGRDYIVARSIVALGESLEVPVLAEGVETEAQARLLRELRCDQAQGYLFARPMRSEAVAELLAVLPDRQFRMGV
jgi:diguanylate cyclase (GGDEF)-like protein/PAS domain S-box-containing protein